jgi:hypothetical protein
MLLRQVENSWNGGKCREDAFNNVEKKCQISW